MAPAVRDFGRAVPGVDWPRVGSTPAEVVHREGTLRVLRYTPDPAAAARLGPTPPLLMVLPVINRWYVLDLTPACSWVAAMRAQGVETYLLDWGRPTLADRGEGLDALVLRRLPAVEAAVLRASGAPALALSGYCLGGTIAACRAALAGAEASPLPAAHAALITLHAPVSFADAGLLGTFTERGSFPLDALLDAFGNMPGATLQQGFPGMKPMQQLTKWRHLFEKGGDPDFAEEFAALELWNADNVPVTGAFYRTLIDELYRDDRLARGELALGGRKVDLGAIRCPTMVVAAEDDPICLPGQATALLGKVASAVKRQEITRGGHVKSVVGKKAAERVTATFARFLREVGGGR